METGIFISQDLQGIRREERGPVLGTAREPQAKCLGFAELPALGNGDPRLPAHCSASLWLCPQFIPLPLPVLSICPKRHQPGLEPPAFLRGRRRHQRHQTPDLSTSRLGLSPLTSPPSLHHGK